MRWPARCGGFIGARMLLGVGEGGAFPGGIKAVAEWFPKKERAFATGLFNAGTNIGAIVTPLVIPVVTLAWGWRAAFIVTGVGGLVWLPIWLLVYRTPAPARSASRRRTRPHRERSRRRGGRVPGRACCGKRETWAYAIGKFLIDPVWWMFLFWLPDFLRQAPRPGPEDLRPAAGGDLSAVRRRQHRRRLAVVAASCAMGWTINRARKTTMLICALLAMPVAFAAYGRRAFGWRWGSSAWRPPPTRASRPTSTPCRATSSRARPWARSSASAA